MSFTTDVIEELLATLPLNKTCCRKAMLYGLLIGASSEEGNIIKAQFKNQAAAEMAAGILKKQFSSMPEISVEFRGRRLFCVEAKSKALSSFIQSMDTDEKSKIEDLTGFRCAECARTFLGGAFIACATVNDPAKGYHLEFSLLGEERARKLALLISERIIECSSRVRGDRFGIYFKNNAAIADILYYIGAKQAGFLMANTYIEKDFANRENRATNCDARNIARSVEATRRHIDAIEWLYETGGILNLSEDLQYTARLRLENPSTSLKDLALLHEPPITKSGLNGRLIKILDVYNEKRKKL